MLQKKIYFSGLVGIIIICFAGSSFGQSSSSFQLIRTSISNGGGAANSSSFNLKESALGGLAVGVSSSGSFVLNGGMLIIDVENPLLEQDVLPKLFVLQQNYPNPFNPTTTIQYSLPKVSEVTIKIFNVMGQVVNTLVQGQKQPGNYQVFWDGKDNSGQQVPSGVYYYQIIAKNFKDVKKMLLVK